MGLHGEVYNGVLWPVGIVVRKGRCGPALFCWLCGSVAKWRGAALTLHLALSLILLSHRFSRCGNQLDAQLWHPRLCGLGEWGSNILETTCLVFKYLCCMNSEISFVNLTTKIVNENWSRDDKGTSPCNAIVCWIIHISFAHTTS